MKNILRLTILIWAIPAYSGPLTIPHEFEAGTPARASEVNENFDAVKVEVDDNSQRIDSKQNTVSGTCPEGSAIRAISADGSVECQSTSPSISNIPYRLFLQNGLNGYSGTTDTSLYKVPVGFNPEPGSFTQIYSEYQADATTGRLALVRFDLSTFIDQATGYRQQFNSDYTISDCSAQVTVNNASLKLFGIPGSGSSGNTPVFLLRYFSETAPLFDELLADWDNANATEAWNKSGTTVENFDDLVGGIFDANEMPTSSFGRYYTFGVEADIVKDWICDNTTNNGMAIEITGGGTGGSMSFFSSETSNIHRRPMLILDISLQ